MKQLIELALIALIIVVAYPLDTVRFVVVVVALVVLYFYAMWNSFNDGYHQAIEDRIY